MPCGYAEKYFRMALNCFLKQDYKGPLELIFLDNSTESVKHLLPHDERIKYHRCDRMPVGALRNLGTFDDRPVIAALVNAVKELTARIKELERCK